MRARFYHIIVVATVAGMALLGCKKKEVSLPTLLINPSDLEIIVTPDSLINFGIIMEAEGGISRFEVTEFINGGASRVIFDSAFSGVTDADLIFSYQMPITKVAYEVQLVFKVYDQENNFGNGARKLVISGVDSLLGQRTGVSIYSYKSGNRNAYFIDTDSVVYSDSVFYGDLDLACTDTSDTLSYNLISPVGNEFVVFNSFNYDSATYRTITQAYTFGTPKLTLNNLQVGDVIITKLSNPTLYDYVLLKLTNIVDDSGSVNDRYVFSIKK